MAGMAGVGMAGVGMAGAQMAGQPGMVSVGVMRDPRTGAVTQQSGAVIQPGVAGAVIQQPGVALPMGQQQQGVVGAGKAEVQVEHISPTPRVESTLVFQQLLDSSASLSNAVGFQMATCTPLHTGGVAGAVPAQGAVGMQGVAGANVAGPVEGEVATPMGAGGVVTPVVLGPSGGRDVQPALVIGRHHVTERDSAPVQYNGIV